MTEQTIGVLMMAVAILWWASLIVRAIARRESAVEVGLWALVLSIACFAAGRIVAGRGMISTLFA